MKQLDVIKMKIAHFLGKTYFPKVIFRKSTTGFNRVTRMETAILTGGRKADFARGNRLNPLKTDLEPPPEGDPPGKSCCTIIILNAAGAKSMAMKTTWCGEL